MRNLSTKTIETSLTGFPKKMAIIDCETTGGKATRDRMTELAIILVDNGKVVERWQSLINPETTVPPWITQITGIYTALLISQPTFAALWPEIEIRLKDRVLVAHNARFDYGFLKNEAKRCGFNLTLKTLCSVKLSRQLYPQYKKHSLDAVIKRLGCKVENRHRAMDDAQVIHLMFTQASLDFDEELIEATCNRLLKRPSLPSQLDESELAKLPDTPGVYYFYNENGRLLYVGKSVNIKTRVLSHFYQDHQTSADHHLSHQLHHIDFKETPTDFGAQILESQQIKSLNPSLNKRLKKVNKLYQYKLSDENGYLKLSIETVKTSASEMTNTFGLFRSRRQATKKLEQIVDEHFLCHRLTGLEKGRTGSCFAHQIKKCMGACCNKEPTISYNIRVNKAMQNLKKQQWPYSGPVLVEEFNQSADSKSFHLINNWCYLGKIKTAEELWSWSPMFDFSKTDDNQASSPEEQFFDLDIYFILIRFLLSEDQMKKTGLKVHLITVDTQFNFE